MTGSLTNVEKFIVVLIQSKQQMAEKENIKVTDDSLSKEYKQGYADAHRDWLNTLQEVTNEVGATEAQEKEAKLKTL